MVILNEQINIGEQIKYFSMFLKSLLLIIFLQSQTLIKTEEDAAMALQVSNALTQALLQYRLKNVPKEV